MAEMMAWFEGEFDNYWQARTEEEEEIEEPHGRIHSIFAPVHLRDLGSNVFYVEQYSDGDPTQIYRQRIYSFNVSQEEQAIVLTIYAPPDTAALVGTHKDKSKLRGLKVEDLKSYPGCEVYWKRDGDAFIGYTKPDACQVVSSRSGRTLVIADDLRLTKDEIWIQDRAEDTEGNYIYGHKGGVPHKLKKVRWFDCWAAAPKEGPDGEEEWDLWRPIRLHDQGDRYELAHEDGRETEYVVELFQAVFEGSSSVPVLELAVREPGVDRSIAYAWASPDSKRIGVNLRKMQIGCTRSSD